MIYKVVPSDLNGLSPASPNSINTSKTTNSSPVRKKYINFFLLVADIQIMLSYRDSSGHGTTSGRTYLKLSTPSQLLDKRKTSTVVSMETHTGALFFILTIYGSLDSAVNLMRNSHSASSRRPVLGEKAAMGPKAAVELMGNHLKEIV